MLFDESSDQMEGERKLQMKVNLKPLESLKMTFQRLQQGNIKGAGATHFETLACGEVLTHVHVTKTFQGCDLFNETATWPHVYQMGPQDGGGGGHPM